MFSDEKQLMFISEIVKEQLGIEEESDDLEEVDPFFENDLKHRINALEKLLKEKDNYIHQLEIKLSVESKRLDLLELKFYEFKCKFKR